MYKEENLDVNPKSSNRLIQVASKLGLIIFGLGLGLIIGYALTAGQQTRELVSPLSLITGSNKIENPYAPYSFMQLKNHNWQPQPIVFHQILDQSPSVTSFLVSWNVIDLSSKLPQKVTGVLNLPSGNGPFPILILNRGYIEREGYQSGDGSRNVGIGLAQAGYITVAPDFLGYGGSDPESNDSLIARFSRPATVLQLLANLEQPTLTLDPALATSSATTITQLNPSLVRSLFDTSRIGLWGHSNGGQIALSILEITGRSLPTALWAPVSIPFPASILRFSDELPDWGKYLRNQLSEFSAAGNQEEDFSIGYRLDDITAPILIIQGTNDDAVPLEWSEGLLNRLREATVAAQLVTYPGADHNLLPTNAWNQALLQTRQFFARQLR